MIHIDLSVPPYSTVSPPHTILKKQFTTWDEARKWVDSMNFKTGSSMDWFYDNPNNEYVQVEVELKEVTGKDYTHAVMSIEGNEDHFDADDPRDHLKYIKGWAQARLTDPLNDPSSRESHEAAIMACNLLEQYLKVDPYNDGEGRLVHIYG